MSKIAFTAAIIACLIGYSERSMSQAPPWIGADTLQFPPSFGAATLDTGISYIYGYYNADMTLSGTILHADTGGSINCYVAQCDSKGHPVWARKIGGSRYYGGSGSFIAPDNILTDENENVYVIGMYIDTAEFIDTVLTSGGYTSIFMVKFDKNGNKLWTRTAFQGQSYMTSGGNIHSVSRGGHIIISDNYDDLLAEFDEAGNLIWSKSLSQSGGCSCLSVDNDLNVYFGGYSQPLLIAKLNDTGKLLWTFTSGSDPYFPITTIIPDSHGNVYVSADLFYAVMLGDSLLQSQDGESTLLIKLDPNGKFLWAHQSRDSIGGPCLLTTDDNDNIYEAYQTLGAYDRAGNHFIAFDQDTLREFFDNHVSYLVKYNPAGVMQWLVRTDTGGYWIPTSLSVSNSGILSLQGGYRGQPSFGSTKLGTNGQSTGYFITTMQVNSTNAVNTLEPMSSEVLVFPNPSPQTFHVQNISDASHVSILNVLGQSVMEIVPKETENIPIDLSAQQAGIYFLRILSSTGVIQSVKLVKE